jgi:hypothetical protein
MAAADRVPPRRLLAGWQLLRALAVALLATGVLPVWVALILLLTAGAGDGVAGGASRRGGTRAAAAISVIAPSTCGSDPAAYARAARSGEPVLA